MKGLVTNQNEDSMLKMFAAAQRLYRDAKLIYSIYSGLSLLIAVSTVIVATAVRSSEHIIDLISFIVTMLYYICIKGAIKHKVVQAAKTQEEIDVKLFGLEWNDQLVGHRVPREVISRASRRFGLRNLESLKDWYPDVSDVPYPASVLICQQSNLSWDHHQRQQYTYILIGAVCIIAFGDIAWMWVSNLPIRDALLEQFVPVISLLLFGIDGIRHNRQLIVQKKAIHEEVLNLIESKIMDRDFEVSVCRRIQDKIYQTRTEPIFVPEWFYRMTKRRLQMDMVDAARDYEKLIQGH